METLKVRIELARPGHPAELRVVAPPAGDPGAALARAVGALGLKAWQIYAVRSATRQVVHARIAERDGAPLTRWRAIAVVEALPTALHRANEDSGIVRWSTLGDAGDRAPSAESYLGQAGSPSSPSAGLLEARGAA